MVLSLFSSYLILPSLIASDNMYMLVNPPIYFSIPSLFPGLLTQILNSFLGLTTGMSHRHLGCNMPQIELLVPLLQSCSLHPPLPSKWHTIHCGLQPRSHLGLPSYLYSLSVKVLIIYLCIISPWLYFSFLF